MIISSRNLVILSVSLLMIGSIGSTYAKKLVQSDDIADDAVTSAKIADGTITNADIQANVIPRITDLHVRVVEHSATFAPNSSVILLANCNENEKVIGGGYRIDGGTATYGKITMAMINEESNGYFVSGYNDSELITTDLFAFAYCTAFDVVP
jgi:hypothetical protein